MRFTQAFDKAWRLALGLVLPPTCPTCEAVLPLTEPVGLCPACYAKLPWWDKTGVLPPELPNAVDAFNAPCLYDGLMREAILRLKFNDGTLLAPILAKLMLPHLPVGGQVLVPVPMHPKALRKRMYNQAALLAQSLSQLANVPADVTSLVRVKPSDGQASRTRAQRLKLSSHDFEAHPRLAGLHVVLIDDIYTTGATARACALALKRAGAGQVSVLTIAYTPHS